jgi:flagellar biogenesis protein FliO
LQPIPYRTESPVTAGKALSVFAMTMVLLAIVGGLLLWARKRGWLQRWSGATASGATSGRNTPRVLGQARLGTASHAYVVEVDGSRFMIVESSRQISLHALSDANAGPGDRV